MSHVHTFAPFSDICEECARNTDQSVAKVSKQEVEVSGNGIIWLTAETLKGDGTRHLVTDLLEADQALALAAALIEAARRSAL